MTGRLNKQILNHQKEIQKKNKQIDLIKNLKKVLTKVKCYDRNSHSFTYDC